MFAHSLAVASLAVGAVVLMMAVAGASPGRRSGTADTWLTSFSAQLWPALAKPYARTTPSASAHLALVGLALLGLGALLLYDLRPTRRCGSVGTNAGSRSSSATVSTCGVCGNMSTGRALTSR
jgi:hypothetical protein